MGDCVSSLMFAFQDPSLSALSLRGFIRVSKLIPMRVICKCSINEDASQTYSSKHKFTVVYLLFQSIYFYFSAGRLNFWSRRPLEWPSDF